MSSGAAPWSVRKPVAADTASVLSRAVPSEPPTCCDVLTIAEATPLSRAGTSAVAVGKDAPRIIPKPAPIRISDGSTCDA
jgi:hypothetical protein